MTDIDWGYPGNPMPLKEKFDYHVLTVKLLAGEGEGITVEVECKGGDKKDCMCDSKYCHVKELILNIGWPDIVRAAGEIELVRLSARMDWTDPEEPWVDVEP
jgi:hypothetical protein